METLSNELQTLSVENSQELESTPSAKKTKTFSQEEGATPEPLSGRVAKEDVANASVESFLILPEGNCIII
jgi:hypothetical protein